MRGTIGRPVPGDRRSALGSERSYRMVHSLIDLGSTGHWGVCARSGLYCVRSSRRTPRESIAESPPRRGRGHGRFGRRCRCDCSAPAMDRGGRSAVRHRRPPGTQISPPATGIEPVCAPRAEQICRKQLDPLIHGCGGVCVSHATRRVTGARCASPSPVRLRRPHRSQPWRIPKRCPQRRRDLQRRIPHRRAPRPGHAVCVRACPTSWRRSCPGRPRHSK